MVPCPAALAREVDAYLASVPSGASEDELASHFSADSSEHLREAVTQVVDQARRVTERDGSLLTASFPSCILLYFFFPFSFILQLLVGGNIYENNGRLFAL
jgi:hypothetical protein